MYVLLIFLGRWVGLLVEIHHFVLIPYLSHGYLLQSRLGLYQRGKEGLGIEKGWQPVGRYLLNIAIRYFLPKLYSEAKIN